ncbi:hypothetical protein GALL_499870 [mine drainage metagenome]|uniref:Uncharacterized protein n=1 Tax=mine drainage metagenome TaxID=410659 RepID=A0A1J5PLH1_9ZZZZ
MGDGHGGDAHFHHDLADQLIDDAGHDGIEAGGRLVKKDDLWLGGDGAGEADTLLHTAGEFGREKVGDLWFEADTAQFLDGDLAGLRLGQLFRAA